MKLRVHAAGVLSYFDSPVYLAEEEGINDKIMLTKDKAFSYLSYRDMEYFMIKTDNLYIIRHPSQASKKGMKFGGKNRI